MPLTCVDPWGGPRLQGGGASVPRLALQNTALVWANGVCASSSPRVCARVHSERRHWSVWGERNRVTLFPRPCLASRSECGRPSAESCAPVTGEHLHTSPAARACSSRGTVLVKGAVIHAHLLALVFCAPQTPLCCYVQRVKRKQVSCKGLHYFFFFFF